MALRTRILATAALAMCIVGGAAVAGATGMSGCCVCTCGPNDQVACFDDVTDRECEQGDTCGQEATTSFLDDGLCTAEHVEGACTEVAACAGAAGSTMAPVASAAGLAVLAALLGGIGLLRRNR